MMNERIRELKYQAEALAYEEHKANCIKNGLDPSMPHANALNMTFEKFARLIVRECINQVNKSNYNSGDEWDKAMTCASNNIKEHFGVEE